MTGRFEIDTDPIARRPGRGLGVPLDPGVLGALADVFVLPSARGHGVGKALVDAMLDGHPRIRWVLFTDDAHGHCAPARLRPAGPHVPGAHGSAGRG